MLFEGQVTIRLADDFSSFVTTVRYAKVFAKVNEYSLGEPAESGLAEDRETTQPHHQASPPKARDVHHS